MVLNLDEEKLARQNQLEEGKPGDNSSPKNGRAQVLSRLNFLRVGIGSSFAFLTWRLWDMQMNRPPQVRLEARQEVRAITVKAPRGIIYDSTGKRLVTNKATYSVTITRHDLPSLEVNNDLSKTQRLAQLAELEARRQAVFDTLARFLGMTYVIGVVPEQFFGDPKKGAPGDDDQNDTLNMLEKLLKSAALDIKKQLTDARPQDLFVLRKDILLSDPNFDEMLKLRDRTGVFFMSEGEKTVFVSTFATADFEPTVVWTGLSREDAIVLEEKRFDLPGVAIQTGYVRDYSSPELFAHLLGYIGPFTREEEREAANKEASQDYINPNDPEDPANSRQVYDPDDKVGLAGVEATLEAYLRGKKGGREVTGR